jgi:hypothetical protein
MMTKLPITWIESLALITRKSAVAAAGAAEAAAEEELLLEAEREL